VYRRAHWAPEGRCKSTSRSHSVWARGCPGIVDTLDSEVLASLVGLRAVHLMEARFQTDRTLQPVGPGSSIL
jgi:hypothetical protein